MTEKAASIDGFSSGSGGVGDPRVSGTRPVVGSLPPGSGRLAYTGFKNTDGTPPPEAISDALTIVATTSEPFDDHAARAKVSCAPQLAVMTVRGSPTLEGRRAASPRLRRVDLGRARFRKRPSPVGGGKRFSLHAKSPLVKRQAI